VTEAAAEGSGRFVESAIPDAAPAVISLVWLGEDRAMTEERLFELAVRASPAEREALLDRECADNLELRGRVEALLAADAEPNFTMDEPVYPTGSFTEPRPEIGTVIGGKYKLVEPIGEGGMGTVWLAQQSEPVQRRVAVKLIKAGMDSRQVIVRFEAERQALAVMDHPNIAKVLDGGLHEGRPYFVMELVKGVPITRYCDAHRLTPRQRLELFVPVCQAIQHAHQKGIIHRDIKPSNVLIAPYDDKPVPKVIDFGLAKATGVSLTEVSMATNFGGVVGTPQYMSPEQASLNNLDIDTRSDVYSLGVLLYELLAGSPPFKRKELEKAGMLEILRVIREEEPPKPSTKLSTAEALPSLSAQRGMDPADLTGLLRDELDWIVLKALEKERTRRYETVNGFARDISRYLAGEPVLAHPPSAVYRIKKFVRRNKGPVLTAGAVAAALLIGIVGFAWQARIAQNERNLARTERDRAFAAESETKKRADELKLVSDFQAAMLEQVNPTEAGKLLTDDVRAKFDAALVKAGIPANERATKVATFAGFWANVNATDMARELIDRTILKPSVKTIGEKFKDQPLVDAQLRQTLAASYRHLGLYDAALPLQLSALATRRRLLGEEHRDTLVSANSMGLLLEAQGNVAAAEVYYRDALKTCRRVLPDNDPNTLTLISNLGTVLWTQNKLAEAEPYYREALEKKRRSEGEDHPDVLLSINCMGVLLWAQGNLNEAEPYFREALQKRRRLLGEEHPNTLNSITNMGQLLRAQGKLAEAEPYFREAMEKSRRVFGEEHPTTLISIDNMGVLFRDEKKFAEAEPYTREALEKFRRVLGKVHPDTLSSVYNMGALLQAEGKCADAEPLFRELLESQIKTLPAGAWLIARARCCLGDALLGQNKFVEAELLLIDGYGGLAAAKSTPRKPIDRLREAAERVVQLYESWDKAEPGKGYDAKAAEWKTTRDAIVPPTPVGRGKS
jgi:serine/threonine protein kinase/Tfp pilus assembly protein PilF